MGDGFAVELTALDGAVRGMGAAAGRLAPAAALPATIPAQAVGHERLADALAVLGRAASAGTGHLLADVEGFRSGLADCRATYAQQEHDVSRALGGS